MDTWKKLDEVIDTAISNIKRCWTCDSTKQPIYEFHIKGYETNRFYCLKHSPKNNIINN